jgi:hypothetical protein
MNINRARSTGVLSMMGAARLRLRVSWVLLLAMVSAAASATPMQCIRGSVKLGRDRQHVYWTISVPRGVSTLRLAPEHPLGRTLESLWRPAGTGGVRIKGNRVDLISPLARHLTLEMSLGRNLGIPDRTYAPFFRFSDGTVALLADDFRLIGDRAAPSCVTFFAPEGAQVLFDGKWGKSIRIDHSQSGYVTIGNSFHYMVDGELVVQDRGLPAWIGESLRKVIGTVVRLYSSELGVRKVPPVLVFSTRPNQPASYYHGDALPNSITLDFSGNAWLQGGAQKDALAQAVGLIAHELFHVWNRGSGEDGAGDLLATEGGADLAQDFIESRALPAQSRVLSDVSAALTDCMYEIDPRRSLRMQLGAHPGKLPYDCGTPFVLAAVSAGRGAMPLRPAFFAAWKSALSGATREGYRWEALLAPRASLSVRRHLSDALSVPGAYVSNIRKALVSAGYELSTADELSQRERITLAAHLMSQLMASDCHGAVGFYSDFPNGFRVARLTSPEKCESLTTNETLTKIDDESPWRNPVALSRRVAAQCVKQGFVWIAIRDSRGARKLACSDTVHALPRPVLLSRRTQREVPHDISDREELRPMT